MSARLITADDVCVAVERTLREHLFETITALKLHQPAGPGEAVTRVYADIRHWDQLPTAEALVSANFPCGAITSPGLVEPPTRRAQGRYDATWRVAVGIYDRGRTYSETQSVSRTWAALVRATLLAHPSLGGVATSLMWVGEEYRGNPVADRAARTIGGCAVAVDVTATNVIDLSVDPTVQAARTTLSLRPQE